MKTKIVLLTASALSLTFFSFKPVKETNIRHLSNGNILLSGAKISSADMKAILAKQNAGEAFIFKTTVTKDKDKSTVTSELATTTPTVPTEPTTSSLQSARASAESILSRYE